MNIICKVFGHKMYRIKPFFNFFVMESYALAVETEDCVRCGDNSHKKMMRLQDKWQAFKTDK